MSFFKYPPLMKNNTTDRYSYSSILLVLIIAALILFIRKPDALLNPQLWAEDGLIFFLQQYERGAIESLFRDYANYLHLVPRLIAWLSSLISPYTFTPHLYNYASFIITLLVIASIFSPRLHVPHKPLLALSVVLTPHYTGEIFLNVTNIQWLLCLALIIMLIKDVPNSKYGNTYLQTAFDSLIIILCGLTGPFIVLLLPLFIIKAFKANLTYRTIILATVVVTAYIQVTTFIDVTAELPTEPFSLDIAPYAQVLGQRVFGGLFLGLPSVYVIKNYGYGVIPYALAVVYMSLLLSLFIYSLKTKNKLALTFLVIHCIMVLMSFYRFRVDPTLLIPLGNGARYLYIPYLMMAWTLIVLLPTQATWKRFVILCGLGLILLSSLTSQFQSPKFVDYQWGSYSHLVGKQPLVIPINPPSWQVIIQKQ